MMVTMAQPTKRELALNALNVWRRYRGTDRHPTQADMDVLRSAYWEGCLPKDPDYSVAQWVEDGFPGF